jgi:hypothetical protein
MARETRQIRIESILGGQSDWTHFGGSDQFDRSWGINPYLPATDTSNSILAQKQSGLLRPVPSRAVETTLSMGGPKWAIPVETGATQQIYLYDAAGSVYTYANPALSGLSDLNDGGSSHGNGAAYYNNYIYFARDTTIARLGPLGGGSQAFVDDYWVTTLGKTALENNTFYLSSQPNHFLHRHSNGRLYIADVLDGQGVLHYIQTKKTTYEGDTDDGSTYDALGVGFKLYPSAIESYGENLVLCLTESQAYYQSNIKAKVAFWDTTSERVNLITTDEFPDAHITAVKNVNGVLYFFSTTAYQDGFKISVYTGGTSFRVIKNFPQGNSPLPGSVKSVGSMLYFGSETTNGEEILKTVFSMDTNTEVIHSIFPLEFGASSVGAIAFDNAPGSGLSLDRPGIVAGAGASVFAEFPDTYGPFQNSHGQFIASQIYKIGTPFKITKITFPVIPAVSSVSSSVHRITPKIYTDSGIGRTYTPSNTNGLKEIQAGTFPGKNHIVLRPENLTGNHDFQLELEWGGSSLISVALPIIIEYESIDE